MVSQEDCDGRKSGENVAGQFGFGDGEEKDGEEGPGKEEES